jgi:metal-responsive CopG/Arc/MetJ family transcriptional regulator
LSPEGYQFLNISIPVDLLKRLDDFRFKKRFASRVQAVIYLLEFALDKHGKGDK